MRRLEQLPPLTDLEKETERVIAEHYPTIYSLRGMSERDYQTPETVAGHIRYFFSQVDEGIDQVGKFINSPAPVREQLKLMFRRLYHVASIKSQVKAMKAGHAEALGRTGGQEDKILIDRVDSQSGRLFKSCQRLAFGPSSPVFGLHINPKVVLICDDVAHSGQQMCGTVRRVHRSYPNAELVISLGTITSRAEEKIEGNLLARDALIYQQKVSDLSEMISQVRSANAREQLRSLAEKFFQVFGKAPCRPMRATHIITPFKLPDGVSNGSLTSFFINGRDVNFLMSDSVSEDYLYPEAL